MELNKQEMKILTFLNENHLRGENIRINDILDITDLQQARLDIENLVKNKKYIKVLDHTYTRLGINPYDNPMAFFPSNKNAPFDLNPFPDIYAEINEEGVSYVASLS